MAMVIRLPAKVVPQDLKAAVITIAQDRSQTVGLGVAVDELEHPLQRCSIAFRKGELIAFGKDVATKEHLDDETVVGDRILEVHSVTSYLELHAFGDPLHAHFDP